MSQLLADIQSGEKSTYLLLIALKEAISAVIEQTLDNFEEKERDTAILQDGKVIMDTLMNFSNSEEEAIRIAVADCLGRLAMMYPNVVIPQLQSSLTDSPANARVTIMLAIRHTMTGDLWFVVIIIVLRTNNTNALLVFFLMSQIK